MASLTNDIKKTIYMYKNETWSFFLSLTQIASIGIKDLKVNP